METNPDRVRNISRASGDVLEYYTAQAIILNNGKIDNPYTRDKLSHLESKLCAGNDIAIGSRVAFFRQISKFFRGKTILGFVFTTDNDGRAGSVADIRLRTSEGIINLSLKRNNHSVKAQRPSGLHAQLPPDGARRYVAGYEKFKRYWLEKLANYSLFSEIPPAVRAKMYESFNKLYAKFINEFQPAATLLSFLLSNDENCKAMLEWSDSKKLLKVYNCSRLQSPDTVYAEVRDNFITLEFFDSSATPIVELSLRLHNASSRITEGFAIKYDTKIVSIGEIYPIIVYK